MERNLDILNKIQKVKAPEDIFANVMSKVNEPKTISLTWIRAAAAIFVVLVCFELYLCKDSFVKKPKVSPTLEAASLADAYQVTNNFIYQ